MLNESPPKMPDDEIVGTCHHSSLSKQEYKSLHSVLTRKFSEKNSAKLYKGEIREMNYDTIGIIYSTLLDEWNSPKRINTQKSVFIKRFPPNRIKEFLLEYGKFSYKIDTEKKNPALVCKIDIQVGITRYGHY